MIVMEQPPADLLISFAPGVRKLVEAAVESWTPDSRSTGLQCGLCLLDAAKLLITKARMTHLADAAD